MKYEYYTQMPGTLATGTDTITINPDPMVGNLTRLKSVYIDLPTGVSFNMNLSALGSQQNDIVSNGNEAGSIVFRSGIMISTPITATVTGPASTPYGVKIITEIETPEQDKSPLGVNVLSLPSIDISNFPTAQDVNVVSLPQVEVSNFPDPQNVKVTNPTPGVSQAGFSGGQLLLVAGLAVGFVYMAMKQKEKTTIHLK